MSPSCKASADCLACCEGLHRASWALCYALERASESEGPVWLSPKRSYGGYLIVVTRWHASKVGAFVSLSAFAFSYLEFGTYSTKYASTIA
eukprot:2873651-Amphidinium_carterae.1